MALDLEGLLIRRVLMHHIPKRREGRLPAIPIHGESLIELPRAAKEAFQLRITESLGKSSHGIEVTIVDVTEDSFFQTGADLLYCNDAEFLEIAKLLADRLAKNQANKELAASKLLIIEGSTGINRHRFVAAIKADLQDGFTEDRENGVTHLQNLFLTQTQRLYKIGFLQEVVSAPPSGDGLRDERNFELYLFDHLMSALETRNAAHYFYRDFLGADILVSDKKLTRDFYDLSTAYINSAPIGQEEKIDFLDALRTELRSNRPIINLTTFAQDNLNAELQQSYLNFFNEKGFENGAFSKNTEYIASRLRKRQKMFFQHGVEITAPPDRLHQLVTITESDAQQTTIVINASLERQE